VPKGGEGKREEFTAIALPYMDTVYSTGLYLSRNPEEAADLLQETFLRAYRSWHQFSPGTNCKAWLLTILYNAFRNRYRSRTREPQTVEFDETIYSGEHAVMPAVPGDPQEIVAAQVLDGEVQAALRQLPQEFLEAVVLVDLQELSYEEAAATLGCPVGTIRSRLSRGRRLLHQALEHYARERGLIR
jgi:RNA polymerase sigma-70 factor (ECF subfamily)